MLFGESAEAPLKASKHAGPQSPTCSVQNNPAINPETSIASNQLNFTENEAQERRLAENRES